MFTLTQAAAKQVRRAAQSADMDELALRIAASRQPDGSIGYRMGFDEIAADDVMLSSRGVDIVFKATHKELLNGTTLDFVELEPGEFQFIFMNPNDPNYVPPSE